VDSGRCLIWALSVVWARRAWVFKPSGLTGSRGQIFNLTSFMGVGLIFLVLISFWDFKWILAYVQNKRLEAKIFLAKIF
jgi:hypothetical protein